MTTQSSDIFSRPITLTTRGSTTSFTECFGQVSASELAPSDTFRAGDIYVRTKEPRQAWYYVRKAWKEVGNSTNNPIRHPTLVPPRVLARTESRLTWMMPSSTLPTPDLDMLDLSDYLGRLEFEKDPSGVSKSCEDRVPPRKAGLCSKNTKVTTNLSSARLCSHCGAFKCHRSQKKEND